jgi:hypothetical protein
MKKINKKLLYGMGAISIVASPIIAVVACGSETPKKPTPPDPTPPKPSIPEISNIVKIDLDKIQSPMELIEKMNESMHFKSNDPVTDFARPTPLPGSNDNYPLTKDQYKKIITNNAITDKTFNFTYKDESLTVSSGLNNDITTIKNSVEGLLSNWSADNGKKAAARFAKRFSPIFLQQIDIGNFWFYIQNVSANMGQGITGYYSLPDDA